MLMDFETLVAKYELAGKITGVIHAGAHLAEEAPDYDKVFGSEVPVWWIEANPAVLNEIIQTIQVFRHQRLIHALVTDADGISTNLHVTGPYQGSSSVLDFGTHPEFSPEIVFTHDVTLLSRTIDSLVAEYEITGVNMLVMDLQGAERLCIAGAKQLLGHVDALLTEVNKADVYVDCAKVWDLDLILRLYGLERVKTHWVDDQGWGDALYLRKAS